MNNYISGKNRNLRLSDTAEKRDRLTLPYAAEKQNNMGFTLLELIVVILIIAALSGAAVMSLSMMSKANTTRAAQELSSVLDRTRLQSMSEVSGGVGLCVYIKDGSCYAELMKKNESDNFTGDGDPVQLCNGSVTVSAVMYSGESGERLTQLSERTALFIEYEKSSGSLKNFITANIDTNAGTVTYTAAGGSAGSVVYDGVIMSGAKTSTVYIVKNTGRCYIE